MAQFDVYRNAGGGPFPLLLDIQADLLSQLATRVVVPLARLRDHGTPITRLNPTAKIRRTQYVLVFQEMAAIPRASLGEHVASLDSQRTELIEAIDLLFTGI